MRPAPTFIAGKNEALFSKKDVTIGQRYKLVAKADIDKAKPGKPFFTDIAESAGSVPIAPLIPFFLPLLLHCSWL